MRSFAPGYYTGASTTWAIADALLTEVRHGQPKAVDMHQHEASYCSLLLDGAYEEWGDGFHLRYEPYTLVFHAARTPHEDRMLGASRFFAVDMLARWDRVIDELGGVRDHVFELSGGDAIWLMLRLYPEFLARADSGSEVESLLYELCAHVAKRPVDDLVEPRWLSIVDATIRESFAQPFDLSALAAAAGVHPTHLCRSFRRFRGRTISEAMLGARVQHVARQINESDETLATIAAEAGFTDQSHMTRAFKRMVGTPPGEYRSEMTRT